LPNLVARILLVDDREANLTAIESVLASSDFELVKARSGREALEQLTLHEFALVLLDVQMPTMDGFAVARYIRNTPKFSTVPIIFLTAICHDEVYSNQAYDLGAVDFLYKPFDIRALRSKVCIFAELWRKSKLLEQQAAVIRAGIEKERDLLLETSLDAVVGVNDQDEVIYWNKQAEAIFGWSRSEALGRRMSEMIIPLTHRDRHRKGMARFLATRESKILNRRIEVPGMRRDGSEFPIELTVAAIEVGAQTKFYSFLRDITLQKKNEMELRDAVQARDDFLGICSHELKTPLTSMKLQFQLAKKYMEEGDPRAFDPDALSKRVVNTNRQITRMTKLIDTMLDLSVIASGKLALVMEVLDLRSLVSEVIDIFSEQLKQVGTSVYVHAPEAVLVNCDRIRLEQVIANLLTNAGLKYAAGKPVEISLSKTDSRAVIAVRDNGTGIAETNLDRIFNRYERAVSRENISGLGLGLYISREIVDAHQGSIEVESGPTGSTFRVYLPVYPLEMLAK
jgi:PAS domain S-box-containing protein